ncbi:hypothetical protein SJAV_01540 [Sulfurisphaera javensis]|uniref:Nuclease n=1 Tax=Sulfurisphaera javensis TaxID=2049879 RepID=A0AAT9GMU5_9CREN
MSFGIPNEFDLATQFAIQLYNNNISLNQIESLLKQIEQPFSLVPIYQIISQYLPQQIALHIYNIYDDNKNQLIRLFEIIKWILYNLYDSKNSVIGVISSFKQLLQILPVLKVEVFESHQGISKSSNYHFVIDGNSLYHISRFAISSTRNGTNITYIVDLKRIYGKRVIEVNASNSGLFRDIYVYPAEELLVSPLYRNYQQVPISYLNNFNFTWLTTREKLFVKNEWNTYYLPMIRNIVNLLNFFLSLSNSNMFYKLPPLSERQINYNTNFPLSYLIPDSSNTRQNSLEVLTKEIHQVWITLEILRYLANQGMLRQYSLNFSQSPYIPIGVFEYENEIYSLWYEFDMEESTMCGGILWYRHRPSWLDSFRQRASQCINISQRTPLRPDIVILKGVKDCNDLMNSSLNVETIIECKNWEFQYWQSQIDTQIKPYQCIFRPRKMIVASLYQISHTLNMNGIIFIDNVYPGGNGLSRILNNIP